MFYFFLLLLAIGTPTSKLQLTLIPQKAAYYQTESVAVSLSLENLGKIPAMVDQRLLPNADSAFGGEITFLVSGPFERPGAFLPVTQSSALTGADVVTLSPKREIVKTFVLSDLYDLHEPGTYMVQAVYHTAGIQTDLPIWRGELISAPQSFRISK